MPLQGATAPTRDTQGAASLALGYVLHWAFIDIIGCGSAIQASLIAFALHDDSARSCKIRNFKILRSVVAKAQTAASNCAVTNNKTTTNYETISEVRFSHYCWYSLH